MADFKLTVPDDVFEENLPFEAGSQMPDDSQQVDTEQQVTSEAFDDVTPMQVEAANNQIETSTDTNSSPQVQLTETVQPDFQTINIGHGSFKIDSRASEEAIKKAKNNYIQNDINFYKGIDRNTGAPVAIRKAVGDALKSEDKLATLKAYYPDAQEFGEDNFIFTNRENGKITLFNPPGFQLKDVAEYTREAAIFTGSTLAGIAGGIGSFALGTPTGPGALVTGASGATAAAVWGGAQTASVYDFLSNVTGETVRTESVIAKAGENVLQGMYSGAGEAVGRVAIPSAIGAIKKGLGGGTVKSQMIYDTLIKNNILPRAGVVTEGRGAGRIEGALEQASASATRMQNQINTIIDGAQSAAEKLALKIGQPKTQQGIGVQIQKAAQSALQRFSKEQGKLETELSEKIGDDALFSIDSLRAFNDELTKLGKTMPRFSERAYGDVKRVLDDLIYDASQNNGRIPYSAFREARTFFGGKMADMGEGVNRAMYKRVYAAMSDDLRFGADSFGLGKMFDETIEFTKSFKNEYDDFLNKVVDFDAPEKGYRFLLNSKKDGGTYFRKLQEQFTDDEWKDVSATIIQKMGYKNFGNEADEAFSVNKFLTNYGDVSKEAAETLFSGMKNGAALQNQLDELLGSFRALDQSAKLRGFSNTGAVTHTLNIMNALGGDATKLVLGSLAITGNIVEAAAGLGATIVGGIVAPNVSARLITSPKFVKWLAEGPAVKTGKEAGEHIGRLIGIKLSNPEIAEEIDAYISAIKEGIMSAQQGTAQ